MYPPALIEIIRITIFQMVPRIDRAERPKVAVGSQRQHNRTVAKKMSVSLNCC